MSKTPNNEELVYSCDALRAIDRDAVEMFGIPSIVLMENAARGASLVIMDRMASALQGEIVIICGSGNNGGDGYAVARHLANQDFTVRIVSMAAPKTEDAKKNAFTAEQMGISILPWSTSAIDKASLIIDAIFGTGLSKSVTGSFADAIKAINTHPAPCIALDIPSGLDCDTGKPLGCCVLANITISFVGNKLGFRNESATNYIGEVHVVDIGSPRSLSLAYAT